MHKREAQSQVVFKHYLQSGKYNGPSAVFELKRTLEDSLPFSAVADHQEDALEASINRSLYYKIPDDSIGLKPFDCFFLRNTLAYVVIGYGKQLKSFVLIPIDEWKHEKKTSKRRSLTYERALQIGHEVKIK
jgi:penicillin-binding protein-related factor A (putative recombinase)